MHTDVISNAADTSWVLFYNITNYYYPSSIFSLNFYSFTTYPFEGLSMYNTLLFWKDPT